MHDTVIGVIGAGSMAATHVAAWHSLGARVHVWSPTTAAAFARDNDCTAAPSLDALLNQCAIVDITSPTPLHDEHVRAAISAGRPMICEKPLARTADTARDLATAAEAAGLALLPAHVVRYMTPYAEAHAAVESGELGAVQSASFSREGSTPAGGTWFDDDAASGGILFDFLIHDYDQAHWMFGEVLRVEATQDPPTVDGVVPALVEAIVTLTHASGMVTTVSGRWGPAGTPLRTSFRIEGEKVVLEDETPRGSSPAHAQPDSDPYAAQLADLAAAIIEGTQPRVSAVDGVAAVRIAEAAHRAAASGTAVGLA